MRNYKWLLIIVGIIALFFVFDTAMAPDQYENWKTYTDSTTGLDFKYPESMGTAYITALDWPPSVQVLDQKFSCTEGGSETARAGETRKKEIGGRTYCITKVTEGAAGSIYTMYAYAFPLKEKTAILTWSTRSVQCANYEEPQRAACEQERASFDMDKIADLIAKSAK